MVTHGHGRRRRGARPHCVGAVVHVVALVLVASSCMFVGWVVLIVVVKLVGRGGRGGGNDVATPLCAKSQCEFGNKKERKNAHQQTAIKKAGA